MSARAEDAARALSREQPTTADAAVPAPANNGSADAEGVEIPAPEPSGNKNLLGRETLSQLVFVLALHFVQHLDGSPPGHGQPVQTHCCSYLQPQRWPTSAHAMSRPGSDDSPGSSPLAAPAAAAEDARDQALSLAREAVQAEVAAKRAEVEANVQKALAERSKS